MPCSTCSHTMHRLTDEGPFWCPRCGTISTGSEYDSNNVPKLVARCREFIDLACQDSPRTVGELWTAWHQLGIAESINLPEERRKPNEHRDANATDNDAN